MKNQFNFDTFSNKNNSLYVETRIHLKQNNYSNTKELINNHQDIFIIKDEFSFNLEINLLDLNFKLIYIEYLYKDEKFQEAKILLIKLRKMILKSDYYDIINLEYCQADILIFLMKIEIKLLKISFLDNIDYYDNFQKVNSLIECFGSRFFANKQNTSNYNQIYDFIIMKRKFKRLSLRHFNLTNSNIQIQADLLKEILELNFKYLAFTKYFIKDIILLRNFFFKNIKLMD